MSPEKFHCPHCGAEPGQPCHDARGWKLHTPHKRYGNHWRVSFVDALVVNRVIYCHDRESMNRLAFILSSTGMRGVTCHDLVVRRKNLRGGYFVEAIDTPLHLSPASETYHSM